MHLSMLLKALSFLSTFCAALPQVLHNIHQRGVSSSTVHVAPNHDAWYTAPADFESATPGSVLRIRTAPGNLTATISNYSAAYNILFRTTNSQYEPSWAVKTVFVPLSVSKRDYSGVKTSLFSYQILYDTDNLDLSPSYILYAAGYSDIPNALGLGLYVSVPDYESPLASFTAWVQTGHATLDSFQAALSAGLGVDSGSRYATWGYSGGSITSEWAAELQVQYVPELNFSGIAISGVVANLASTIESVDPSP